MHPEPASVAEYGETRSDAQSVDTTLHPQEVGLTPEDPAADDPAADDPAADDPAADDPAADDPAADDPAADDPEPRGVSGLLTILPGGQGEILRSFH
jgi:hypothetical protein